MNSESQFNSARQFVQAFAGISSTEDLIFYVAGTDNMLALCRLLIEQHDLDGSSPLVREFDRYCAAQGIPAGALYAEIRKVLLALNRYHDADRDHYAVLGLQSGAPKEQVKKAFRELSKKHHPDKQQNHDKGSQHFMEITGAYHAIMSSTFDTRAKTATPWRRYHAPPSGHRLRDQKVFFSIVFAIICLLGGASIYISGKHHHKVLLSQLHAYVMPAEQSSSEAQLPSNGSAGREPLQQEPIPATAGKKISAQPDASPEEPTRKAAGGNPLPPIPGAPYEINKIREQEGLKMMSANRRIPLEPLPAIPLQESLPPITQPLERQAPATQNAESTKPEMQDNSMPAPSTELELQEKTARINRINASLEISSLIKRYSTLYSDREISPFYDLFAEHAEENGNPLFTFIDKYRSLFARTRTIDLKIEDINWNEHDAGYLARGSFKAAYAYTNGKTSQHQGKITFYLIEEQGRLKIKSLDYTFAK